MQQSEAVTPGACENQESKGAGATEMPPPPAASAQGPLWTCPNAEHVWKLFSNLTFLQHPSMDQQAGVSWSAAKLAGHTSQGTALQLGRL